MQKTRAIVLTVLFVSFGLRLILAYITREANDNHMEVISWIADKHELPQRGECWECFQPKFFYVISSGIITVFNIQSVDHRMIAVQFLNAILGFFTVLLFLKFIKRQSLSDTSKLLMLSLFAFNPCLTGINVQATNDTLEIFCGVSAVYFCDSFFRNNTITDFAFLLVSILAAALTKATGILLFFVIVIFFIIKIYSSPSWQQKFRLTRFLGFSILSFIVVVLFAGGYYSYYRKNNSLPSSVWNKDHPPALFRDTYITRPGIKNIADGFFTFRYIDMIYHPCITNDGNTYPLNRTSLWSQLYGRTVFLQFDQWPEPWQTHAPVVIFVGRVLILLGIIPLLLFLTGLLKGVYRFFKNILKEGKSFLHKENNYLHLGVTLALFAAITRYCYDYRDFSAMKSIYIFPGFISYIKLIIDGYISVKKNILIKIVNSVLIVMVVFSVIDICHLIYQLQYRF